MSSWKSYKLGDIAEITSSKRIFYSEYVPSGIPFWRSKEIIEKFNRKNISTDLFISNEKYQEIKSKFGVPQQNDILLTSVGTLGIPYLVQSDEQFYFKDGNLTWIKNINNELLNPLFLFKWLASSIGRESLSEITIGSTQEALTISGLKTLELLLPPLEEQKAIAEVLSSLDDKIDLLHRQNQTLESLAQTLFRQWFIEEAKEEWEIVTLGDLGKVVTGKTPSTSNEDFWGEDIPFITPTDFKNYNKYAFSSDRKLSTIGKNKVKNSVLPKNSILVTCIGSDMGKVVITKNECVTNQQINSLVLSNDDLLNEYVFQYLKNIYPLLRAIALGGTTMPIINKTDFENIEILLPTDEVLERFQSITLSSNQKIIENTKQIQTLENLRDTLLPKLLSGEVRVKI